MEQRTVLVSKSFYLKYSGLEEPPPPVETGRGTEGDVGWGTASRKILRPCAVRAAADVSAEHGPGSWGFLSSHQAPPLGNQRDSTERTCLQTSVSLDAPLLTGGDTFLVVFMPTPSPGLPSYSKPSIIYATVSQNSTIYVPPFMASHASSCH